MNDWQREIEELRRRQALAQEMGGADRVARQRSRGKLTVRERIEALLDRDTFREWGSLAGEARYDATGVLAGIRASSCIGGWGDVDSRRIVVSADDFTVRGGSSEGYHHEKNAQLEKLAGEYGLPLVRLLDGTGGGGSVAEVERMGATYVPFMPGFDAVVANLGRVPVIALGLGPVAGAGMFDHTRFRFRIAWPSGDWGSLPAEGGIDAAFKAQLDAAPDPEAARRDIRERLDRLRSPFRSAERFYVEEIVQPAQTRRWLCDFARMTGGRDLEPQRFHCRP